MRAKDLPHNNDKQLVVKWTGDESMSLMRWGHSKKAFFLMDAAEDLRMIEFKDHDLEKIFSHYCLLIYPQK